MPDFEILLKIAGLAQLVLVVGSFFIPKQLNWFSEFQSVNKLLRQLFWTYAGYILGSHLFFGLISFFAADELIAKSELSAALLILMGLWWTVRIALQFCYFDRSCIPQSRFNFIAEVLLVMLFVSLASVYWSVFFIYQL